MCNEIMDSVLLQICEFAKKYDVEKLVLFGSRARGDNSALSDYDIAVFKSGISAYEKASFSLDMEEVETLKKIDLVFVDEKLDHKLMENIKNEGVIIYEQAGN